MSVPVPPPPKLNPRLGSHQVIVRPLVTEKGMHRAQRNGAYSFQVVTEATKPDIRRAVEEMFNVKVEKVAEERRGPHAAQRSVRFKKTDLCAGAGSGKRGRNTGGTGATNDHVGIGVERKSLLGLLKPVAGRKAVRCHCAWGEDTRHRGEACKKISAGGWDGRGGHFWHAGCGLCSKAKPHCGYRTLQHGRCKSGSWNSRINKSGVPQLFQNSRSKIPRLRRSVANNRARVPAP